MVTSIQVQDNTWLELNAKKLKGESFDDVIKKLLLSSISLKPKGEKKE